MVNNPIGKAVGLTIAGSDPSGGAGLQADLKAFHQHGVYGASVVTLLTVQNTVMVDAVECLPPEMVLAQLDAVLVDIPPLAAKTGALGNAAIIEALASRAKNFGFPLIVDPVMVSKHGIPLIAADAIESFIRHLMPCAWLLTPNLHEAGRLTGRTITSLSDMENASRALVDGGAKHVLVKGGHLEGQAIDLLLTDGHLIHLPAPRINTPHTHGTGCVLSASITARLALGDSLVDAVRGAKEFISRAIATNPGLGKGHGPVNLFAPC
jgi:hydroxymethylpyrimidine/phosphomethylpyrimidine kinase